MARPHKIKRYKGSFGSVKAKPHPLAVTLSVILIAALLFVGASLFPLVYDFVVGRSEQPDPEPPINTEQVEGDTSEPSSTPVETPPIPVPVGELRAVYLPQPAVNDVALRLPFLDSISGTDINAVMVDVKDRDGTVLFNTANQKALQWNARAENAFDLRALSDELSERGLRLVVRMSAFRDAKAAYGNPDLAVNYRGQKIIWLDNYPDQGGKPWLNPYSSGVRRYLTDLALEAVDSGAVLVVLEDFQFPPNSFPSDAGFPESDGIDRRQALDSFARELTDTLSTQGARLAIYFSAATLAGEHPDILYGGSPTALSPDEVLLGALPYQFPNNYTAGGLSIPLPLADPAATVSTVVQFGKAALSPKTTSWPLIQGGSEAAFSITPEQVRAQIDTLAMLGYNEYILYCTDASSYLF